MKQRTQSPITQIQTMFNPGLFSRVIIFPFLFLTTLAFGQTGTALPVICGNEVFDHIVRNRYPALHQTFQTSFEENLRRSVAADRSPKTVRVVVHVVWKNPEENLHDSIILNQMTVLNEDYNRQNPDTARLRAIFQHVAGNTDIHFELAEIKRVQTNTLFEIDLFGTSLLSNLKNTGQGGSDARDPSKFINIWICKIQPIEIGGIELGQILGFAFPPNNLGNWPPDSGAPTAEEDGVVLDFRVVGRNNPNMVEIPGAPGPVVVRGRTATHEVGHYLGLRHIWGDGGGFGSPNDCDQSDGINDTPFANAESAADCDTTKNSCPNTEPFYNADMPDLVENYMDYSSEDCMNMFTKGQATLVQNVLDGPRKGLLQTSNLTFPGSSSAGLPLIYPNPARPGSARLLVPAGWQPLAIDVINAEGRVVYSLPVPLGNGDRHVVLGSENLLTGWYAVRIQTANQVWVDKLLIH
ncbi:MAG: zinc-dependent metalloprotease [Saprospiraceae bacterium]